MHPADELRSRGVAAMTAGRHREARVLFDRALAASPSPDARARIHVSQAFLAFETGDSRGAFELCERARSTPGITSECAGLVDCQQGLLLSRSARLSDALRYFSVGIGRLEDPVELGRALLNRGGVFLSQGNGRRAIEDLERAVELWQRAGRGQETTAARHNLGYAYYLTGDLVSALQHMDAVAVHMSGWSPKLAATIAQDRAEVLLAAGLSSDGRRALREAARILGRHRLPQRRGEAELVLARTLLQVDPAEALRTARGAARRFERVDAPQWLRRAEAVALAAEVNLGRSGPGLVERGDALVGCLTESGLTWPAIEVRLHAARVLVRRGELDDAATRLARVRVPAGAPATLRLLAHDVRAEFAEARGRRGVALQHLRSGLDDLHTWQSTFGSLDLQTMVIGHGVPLAQRGLRLAVESGRPDVVLEWSERARMLASRVHPVRAADPSVADDLGELRQLLASPELRVPEPRRARELRHRVRERAWQVAGSGEVSDPASLAELTAGLGADRALVAWIAVDEDLIALVVDADGPTTYPLGPLEPVRRLLDGLLPDLDVAATDLPTPLARSVRSQLAARLAEVSAVLVEPLLDRLGDHRVVLTPSGVLAGVPWTLVPGLVGRPVEVARSATSWLARQDVPRPMRTAGFVAGPRVARAEAEVREVAGHWDGASTLVGDDANPGRVSQLAGEVDVLHLAVHGRHSADNPLFSGVELVGGPWFGYDIDQLDSVPSVVLLSACEVGRSTVRYGEELIGMTSAWLHAGAREVIGSPSAVSDEAAHDVLIALHAGLAAGLDPAAALAAAVPAVSEDRPPAPFVCFV